MGAALGQKGPIPLPPALHRIRIPQFVNGKSVLKPSNESPGTDAGHDQVGTGLDDACQRRPILLVLDPLLIDSTRLIVAGPPFPGLLVSCDGRISQNGRTNMETR